MSQMIDGLEVKLGGKDYILPPMNFKALRKAQPYMNKLFELKGFPSPDEVKMICEIILSAFHRNYPTMELDFLEDNIDMGNWQILFQQVLLASGMKKKTEGEA